MTSAQVVAHILAVVDGGRIDSSASLLAARGRRAEVVYEQIPLASLQGPAAGETRDGAQTDGAKALAHLAVRYDSVLRQLVLDGPVLPVRLGTTASDVQALTRFVERHDDQLGEELDRLRDYREWHVRARRADPAHDSGSGSGEDSRDDSAQLTGTEYLRRARQRLARSSSGDGEEERTLGSADERISRLALEADGSLDLTGGRRAYLLRRSDEQPMAAVLEELTRDRVSGIAVELTGPLPPYSFVRLALEET